MLLKNISDEFVELRDMLKNANAYINDVLLLWTWDDERITMKSMIDFIPATRNFVYQSQYCNMKNFKSTSIQKYMEEYFCYCDEFTYILDTYLRDSISKFEDSFIESKVCELKDCSLNIYKILNKIDNACEILEMAYVETWEPLPQAIKEDVYEDVTILSETKSVSLSSVSKDISTLDNFLINISSLIKETKGNNFYLRKVESGSLAVVISCIAGASQIVSFIFFYIKLCQNTEKRELKNEERKLELINKSLDTAKKILEINPQNTEANEIVQKCGLYILEFLENNPKGTINNQSYDIGAEKLKIEEKKEN